MLYKNITECGRSGTSDGPSETNIGRGVVATFFWLNGEIYDFVEQKKEIFEDGGGGGGRAAIRTPFGGPAPHFRLKYPPKIFTLGVRILYPI